MVKSLSLLVHLNQKRRRIYKHMRRRMNEKYNDINVSCTIHSFISYQLWDLDRFH